VPVAVTMCRPVSRDNGGSQGQPRVKDFDAKPADDARVSTIPPSTDQDQAPRALIGKHAVCGVNGRYAAAPICGMSGTLCRRADLRHERTR
jgi:hypothetical protein